MIFIGGGLASVVGGFWLLNKNFALRCDFTEDHSLVDDSSLGVILLSDNEKNVSYRNHRPALLILGGPAAVQGREVQGIVRPARTSNTARIDDLYQYPREHWDLSDPVPLVKPFRTA
jgi:hypothetical protein